MRTKTKNDLIEQGISIMSAIVQGYKSTGKVDPTLIISADVFVEEYLTKEYSTVDIDMSDETLIKLAELSMEADITISEVVVDILEKYIEEKENEEITFDD